MSNWYTHQVEKHYGIQCANEEMLQVVGRNNALGMFPRLRERIFMAGDRAEARRLQCML